GKPFSQRILPVGTSRQISFFFPTGSAKRSEPSAFTAREQGPALVVFHSNLPVLSKACTAVPELTNTNFPSGESATRPPPPSTAQKKASSPVLASRQLNPLW